VHWPCCFALLQRVGVVSTMPLQIIHEMNRQNNFAH